MDNEQLKKTRNFNDGSFNIQFGYGKYRDVAFQLNNNGSQTNNTSEIFNFKNAGVCLYVRKPYRIMMINRLDKGWEFLGGRVSRKDINLLHTALREASEESNGNIMLNDGNIDNNLINLIKHIKDVEYIPWNTYIDQSYGLFFIELHESSVFDSETYGNREIYDNINRTIHWLEADNLQILDKIHFKADNVILENISDILDQITNDKTTNYDNNQIAINDPGIKNSNIIKLKKWKNVRRSIALWEKYYSTILVNSPLVNTENNSN